MLFLFIIHQSYVYEPGPCEQAELIQIVHPMHPMELCSFAVSNWNLMDPTVLHHYILIIIIIIIIIMV